MLGEALGLAFAEEHVREALAPVKLRVCDYSKVTQQASMAEQSFEPGSLRSQVQHPSSLIKRIRQVLQKATQTLKHGCPSKHTILTLMAHAFPVMVLHSPWILSANWPANVA